MRSDPWQGWHDPWARGATKTSRVSKRDDNRARPAFDQRLWHWECGPSLADIGKVAHNITEGAIGFPTSGLQAAASQLAKLQIDKEFRQLKNQGCKMLRMLANAVALQRHFTEHGADCWLAKLNDIMVQLSSAPLVDPRSDDDMDKSRLQARPGTEIRLFSKPEHYEIASDANETSELEDLKRRVELLEKVFIFVDWDSLPAPEKDSIPAADDGDAEKKPPDTQAVRSLVSDIVSRGASRAASRRQHKWVNLCDKYAKHVRSQADLSFGLELILAQMERRLPHDCCRRLWELRSSCGDMLGT